MAKTSSSMKRAEEDRPKGVDMAPSQWLEKIVHENQKYYGLFITIILLADIFIPML
jgi:hypothetical protein